MVLPNTSSAHVEEAFTRTVVTNAISPASQTLRSGLLNRDNTNVIGEEPKNVIQVDRNFDMQTYSMDDIMHNQYNTAAAAGTVPYVNSKATAALNLVGLGEQNGTNPKLYRIEYGASHNMIPSTFANDPYMKNAIVQKVMTSAYPALMNSIDKNFLTYLFADNYVKKDGQIGDADYGAAVAIEDEVGIPAIHAWTTPLYSDTTNFAQTRVAVKNEISDLIDIISKDEHGNRANYALQAYFIVPETFYRRIKNIVVENNEDVGRYASDTVSSRLNTIHGTYFTMAGDDVCVVGLPDDYFPIDTTSSNPTGILLTPSSFQCSFKKPPQNLVSDFGIYSVSNMHMDFIFRAFANLANQYGYGEDILSQLDIGNNVADFASSNERFNMGALVNNFATLFSKNFNDSRFLLTHDIFRFYGYENFLTNDGLSQASFLKVDYFAGIVRSRPVQMQRVTFDPALLGVTPPAIRSSSSSKKSA